MKILLTTPAITIYDAQERVMGWRHTPASRDHLKSFRALVKRLRELDVERIIASDLDEQSAACLARRLDIPYELWQQLRRFNFGKHHGDKRGAADALLSKLREQWKSNPDVPIGGGDSQTSYQKRLAAAKERLSNNGQHRVLVILGPMEIEALAGAKAERGHIYELEIPDGPKVKSTDTAPV